MRRINKVKDARRRSRKAAERLTIKTGTKIVPDKRRKLDRRWESALES